MSGNPTEQEMIERGIKVFEDCYNGVIPTPERIDANGYSGMSMKMFHDFWGGIDQLSMRDKRMVVMGCLAASGLGDMFAIHAESGLRNGEITAEDLRGVVLMALPYVGYPKASPCLLASEKVIAKFESEGGKR